MGNGLCTGWVKTDKIMLGIIWIAERSIISSPVPKAQKVSLLDDHALASVRPLSTISKSSSETVLPIKAKLRVEHP